VLLGREWQGELLASRPSPVDRVVPVPVAAGVREDPGAEEDPEALEAFFARMRAERFDLALQLHGGGRASNPFVRRLGATLTAGSHSPDAERLDRSIPYVYLQPEVLRYLEVVGLVGAEPVTLTPRLAVTDADRAAAAAALDGPGPFALLHPGATDPRRRWPAASFARVGDALAAQGATVLVNGGPPERELVDAVLDAMERPARAVTLGLQALVGALAGSAVVVANDTGPLHVAGAVGAATVGLYWGPNALNSPPAWRARHRPFAVIDVRCPVCGTDNLRGACAHDVSFVAAIEADEVAAAAVELLGAAPPDPGALARALDPRAAASTSVPAAP
jgi:ADP-heptose:LPS heptosyltransferase